jgi:hypothetical protein
MALFHCGILSFGSYTRCDVVAFPANPMHSVMLFQNLMTKEKQTYNQILKIYKNNKNTVIVMA